MYYYASTFVCLLLPIKIIPNISPRSFIEDRDIINTNVQVLIFFKTFLEQDQDQDQDFKAQDRDQDQDQMQQDQDQDQDLKIRSRDRLETRPGLETSHHWYFVN